MVLLIYSPKDILHKLSFIIRKQSINNELLQVMECDINTMYNVSSLTHDTSNAIKHHSNWW